MLLLLLFSGCEAMNKEEEIKNALADIITSFVSHIIKNMKYDVHFVGQVVAKNENGTFEVKSSEKRTIVHAVKYSTVNEPQVGDRVYVRETKNVPNSYVIDFIDGW